MLSPVYELRIPASALSILFIIIVLSAGSNLGVFETALIMLAPTGALIVMMVYYTYTVQLFEFSLSPLMQLMLQVSL